MAENKTKANDKNVQAFLDCIDDDKKRQDSLALIDLMREATGAEPQMWGDSIVGFGSYHYKYASGREGDSPLAGFSPRKQALTLYILAGFDEYDGLMSKLGKYKTGKACLYLKKLEDVDIDTLKELVTRSAAHMAKTNSG